MNAHQKPLRPQKSRRAHALLTIAMALVTALGAMPAAAVTAKMAIEHRHALWIDQGNVYGVGANAWCSTVRSNPWDSMLPKPIFTGDVKAVSVAVAGLQSAILFADGTAVFRGISNAPIADRYCYQAPFPMRGITDIALLGGGTPEGGVLFISGGQVYRWTGLVGDPAVAMAGGVGAKSISAGNAHVVVVYCDGSAATWGSNSNGQLGKPAETGVVRLGPSELTKLQITGVDSAQATGHTTLLRLNDGRTLVFGAVNVGLTPSPSGASGATGWNQPTPAPLYELPANTVKLIITGSTVYALTKDGRVHMTGWKDQPGAYIRGFVAQPYPVVRDMSIGQNGVIFDLGIPGQRYLGLTGRIQDVDPSADLLDPSTGATVLRSFSFSPMPASLTGAESEAAEDQSHSCRAAPTTSSTDKTKGNNGFGNGDQAAPGNSSSHNNAENSTRAAVEAKAAAEEKAKAEAAAKAKAEAAAKAQAEAQAKAKAAADAKAAAEAKAKAEAATKAKAEAAAKAQAEAQAKAKAAADAKAAAEAKAKAEAAAKAKAEAAAKAQAEAQAKAKAAADAKAAAEAKAKAEAAAKAKAEAAAKARAEAQAKAKAAADAKAAAEAKAKAEAAAKAQAQAQAQAEAQAKAKAAADAKAAAEAKAKAEAAAKVKVGDH